MCPLGISCHLVYLASKSIILREKLLYTKMLTYGFSYNTILIYWILSAAGVECVLWSLLLTNPNLGDGTHSIYPKTAPKYSAIEHLITVAPAVKNHRHHHGKEFCADDHMCKKGMFCDKHYGICDYLRKEGGHCRRDHHCENGHECVFGHCRKYVKKGDKGARCQDDSDCGASMCCARHHGEYVCKPRLPVGHRCFIPSGGLDYALNEMCPCEKGLVCKLSSEISRFKEEFSAEFHSTNNNVRCSSP